MCVCVCVCVCFEVGEGVCVLWCVWCVCVVCVVCGVCAWVWVWVWEGMWRECSIGERVSEDSVL